MKRNWLNKQVCLTGFFLLFVFWLFPGAVKAQKQELVIDAPFDYLGGAGLGPEAILKQLLLRAGTENATVSWVLIQAVQSQQLAFQDLDNQHPEILAPAVWHSTGQPTSVKDELIQKHNQTFQRWQLDPHYIYGISYQLRYNIRYDASKPGEAKKPHLVLGCKTILYRKGGSSPYKLVPPAYSGEFFAQPILKEIHKRLNFLKKLQSPAWL